MHTYYELKDMLHDELSEIAKKGELSAGSLDTVDKLLNSIKNACKIIMYEEYSEDGYSYAGEGGGGMSGGQGGGYSNARGGQRRDGRGRYSREGGYSNARGGRGGRGGGYSRASGYSYGDDDKMEKIEILREMKEDAQSEDERRTIDKIIRRMERE